MAKATAKQIIEAMVALLCARAYILLGKETLQDIGSDNPWLNKAVALSCAVPATVVINQYFQTDELRQEAFKVLAKMV